MNGLYSARRYDHPYQHWAGTDGRFRRLLSFGLQFRLDHTDSEPDLVLPNSRIHRCGGTFVHLLRLATSGFRLIRKLRNCGFDTTASG